MGNVTRLIRRVKGCHMINNDLDLILSQDTKEWLSLVATRSKLHASHYRILTALRDLNMSPSVISEATGLDQARVRKRLKDMAAYGYVEVVETLSDRTQVWGLIERARRPNVNSYPTEAHVQERRKQQGQKGASFDIGIPKTWEKADGVVRPRNPAKVDQLDLSSLKKYEAKANS